MQQRGLRKFELGSAQRLILSAAKPRHASPQQPNGLSRGALMRFNAHAKGGIKNLQGATEPELILAPGDLSSGRHRNTLLPFRNRPGPRRQHAPRPPGAASTVLILPCSVTRSRQRTVPVIGYRSGGSAPRSARVGYVEGQIVTIGGTQTRRACAPRKHAAEYVRILQGRSLAPNDLPPRPIV